MEEQGHEDNFQSSKRKRGQRFQNKEQDDSWKEVKNYYSTPSINPATRPQVQNPKPTNIQKPTRTQSSMASNTISDLFEDDLDFRKPAAPVNSKTQNKISSLPLKQTKSPVVTSNSSNPGLMLTSLKPPDVLKKSDLPVQTKTPSSSKWAQFIDEPEEEGEDDAGFTTVIQSNDEEYQETYL